MAISHLDMNNFDAAISEGVTLVDFWATWCGPCRMQAPILEKLDAELGDSVKIGKVDVDENPMLAQRFGVMSIPTLIAFRGGQVVSQRVGVQSLDDAVLSTLGRVHDAEQALHAIELARDAVDNVSADVICGVPGQSSDSLRRTVGQLVDAGVSHISVYPLTVEEGTPLSLAIERGGLPDVDEDERPYRVLCNEYGKILA